MPHFKRLGASTLALAAVGASGLVGGDSAPATPFRQVRHGPVQPLRDATGAPMHSSEAKVASETFNWSGYAVAKYQTTDTYTAATATWIVPTVTFGPTKSSSTPAEYSSTWVGVGGYCKTAACGPNDVDQTLIQLGTEQDAASDGQTQYYAWYELLPADPFEIPLTINPGDTVTASLACTANCTAATQTWELTMAVRAQSWSKTFRYRSSRLSAVYIEEAPTGAGGVLPLSKPDSPVAFVAMTADGTAREGLSVTENGIAMVNPAGQTSVPSATDGDAFQACWGYKDASDLAVCERRARPVEEAAGGGYGAARQQALGLR